MNGNQQLQPGNRHAGRGAHIDDIAAVDPLTFTRLLEEGPAYTDLAGLELSVEQERLANHWMRGSDKIRDIYRFLLGKQLENGQFRDWIEGRESTARTREAFASFGLDYAAWDDPHEGFELKEDLERVIVSPQAVKDSAKHLMDRLVRGDLRTYLNCTSASLWQNAEPAYRAVEASGSFGDVLALAAAIEPGIRVGARGTNPARAAVTTLKRLAQERTVEYLGDNEIIYVPWRRQPSYDFCEGNDSDICFKLGGKSEVGLPHVMLDTAISLLDIHIGGERMGQVFLAAMHDCENGEPVLMVDSLEACVRPRVNNRQQRLYASAHEAVSEIARSVGFPQVFMHLNTLYSTHSTGYRNYVRGRLSLPQYECKTLRLSKFGDLSALEILREFADPDDRFTGRMHHLDADGHGTYQGITLKGIVQNIA